MAELPSGTVTFLFTDIEGSTRLWERHPQAMPDALARHDAIMRQAIVEQNGVVYKVIGDAFQAAFPMAPAACAAALAAQRALTSEAWGVVGAVPVRMALHTCAAVPSDGDYRTGALNRLGRLLSAVHGGQIVLSRSTADLARDILPPEVTLRDLGVRHLRDLRPEPVFQLVTPKLPADFPPLKTLDILRTNLPAQLTSFVGREKEMAELKAIIAANRLVTLTGPGGMGKTRLSLHVAADLVEDFADGVWFIELAPLTDPAVVPQTVAATLGLREEVGRPIAATLTDYLRDRHILLILDNCEHLVEACAQLVESLMRGCANVKVLTSSRETLGIAGELPYRVVSLSVADPRKLPPIEVLARYEAVRLFVERATVASPSFALTSDNAATITQLTSWLDGIPLAIELAAVRVKVLRVEEVAKRLDDRFRLLTGGSRTVLPRHQTLRALIDWSYDLLTDHERLFLLRLSVFVGGWTLEAAEEVCAGDGLNTDEVLDLIAQLVNKSLVDVVEHSHSGETRYRMLETIREYAREKLIEAGHGLSLHTRHLEFIVTLTEQAQDQLHTTGQELWYGRLEDNHDNIRAALAWALQARAIEQGLRIVGALYWFWWVKGYWSEGREWSLQFISQPEAQARTYARAQAVGAAGDFISELGDPGASEAYFRECIAIGRELGDAGKPLVGLWQICAAYNYNAWGRDVDEARQALEDGLRAMEGTPARVQWIVAWLHHNLGESFIIHGEDIRGREHSEKSMNLFRAMGDRYMAAYPLRTLSLICARQGQLAEAKQYLNESLAVTRASGDRKDAAFAFRILGEIACGEGQYDEAGAAFAEALTLCRALGWQMGIGTTVYRLAFVEQLAGNLARALELYEESLPLCVAYGGKGDVANVLDGIAQLESLRGNAETAARLFGASLSVSETSGSALWDLMQAAHERWIQQVCESLGEETFAALEQSGQAMTLEQAVKFALNATL